MRVGYIYTLLLDCNLEMEKSDHRSTLLGMDHLAGVADASPIYKQRFEARWLAEDWKK